ncbi:uncharacterized protein LOC117295937 [Asterias rubens]|nr:uncharacterized protein LOC117295937 [Asterias rubens]
MTELLEVIIKRNKTFKELFDNNDMDKLADSLYAPDCKMMVPGEKTTEGNQDAKKLLSTLKAEGALAVSLGAIEVGPMGGKELLYERGDYSFNNADNVTLKIGKYLVIWKLIDGEYKRYTEILNGGNNNV